MIELIGLLAFASTLVACASKTSWRLNLASPFAIYATVFALYEFGPIVVWAIRETPQESTGWAVLGMALLALLGVAIGMRLGLRLTTGKPLARRQDVLPRGSLMGALTITVLMVVLSTFRYFLLISQGAVNTHAVAYLQQTTVFESVFIVFASQGRFAVILLLGFICHSSSPKTRPLVFRLLIVYTFLLEVLLVVTSETRPALTGAICFLVAWRYAGQRPISLRLLLSSAVGALIVVAVIQQVRLQDLNTIRLSDSPLATAGTAVVAGVGGLLDAGGESGFAAASSRASDGPRFTGMIWERLATRGDYLNGTVFWYALQTMVPRVMIPNKDKTIPLDAYIEGAIGLPDVDGCLTSYAYAFAEGGWLMIFLFHILLGFGLAVVTGKATSGFCPVWWLACAFGWEVVLQMETEIVSDGLTALRCIAVYGVLLGAYSVVGRRNRKGRGTAARPLQLNNGKSGWVTSGRQVTELRPKSGVGLHS